MRYVKAGSPAHIKHIEKRAAKLRETAKFCVVCGKPLTERILWGLHFVCSEDCAKGEG